MEEKRKQKKRERRYWENEFDTHEFNNKGEWVPKSEENVKTPKKARRSKRKISASSLLKRNQARRICLNRLKAENKRRALDDWKRRWHYREPAEEKKI